MFLKMLNVLTLNLHHLQKVHKYFKNYMEKIQNLLNFNTYIKFKKNAEVKDNLKGKILKSKNRLKDGIELLSQQIEENIFIDDPSVCFS